MGLSFADLSATLEYGDEETTDRRWPARPNLSLSSPAHGNTSVRKERITVKKLPIAGVAVAVAITFAPFGPVAQAGDPCDILSNSPSGYASCKADEANVPGFREKLQQQQHGEIGNCADERGTAADERHNSAAARAAAAGAAVTVRTGQSCMW